MSDGLQFLEFEGSSALADEFGERSADYLEIYLRDLGVTSIALEGHYIDRHYLDEFANYYSKSFSVPEAHCRRFHFFSQCSQEELEQAFLDATSGSDKMEPALETLQKLYLGFIVQRPLEAARVGRTVLKTYPDDGRRFYKACRRYDVHIAGLKLSVEGLAFQHQDRGAAVCASTALWSALQRVAFAAGRKTATPHAITRAACSPYPASDGLRNPEMATALSKLGYIADFFEPEAFGNSATFRALLVASLDSGLPVVLSVSTEEGAGHAVTLTGYAEPPGTGQVPLPLLCDPLEMASAQLKVVYVHDDNLGPHAHYELLDGRDGELVLQRGDASSPRPPSWRVDRCGVFAGLVPKPAKLRMPIPDLLKNVAFFTPSWTFVFGTELRLHYKCRFATGVEVKQQLLRNVDADPDQRQWFLLNCSLPRHVGVLSAITDQTPLCEVVIDVTEVDRAPGTPSVLGLLAVGVESKTTPGIRLSRIAKLLGVPIVHKRAS